MKKYEHPTGTIASTFHKPVEEKIRISGLNHALGQVLSSMNADPINMNKHVNNQ